MKKINKNKIIYSVIFIMSILIINCCTAKQKVEAKETNQLYSYVDSKSGLCGFVDKKGKVIIKPIYDSVGDFSDGLAAVQNSDSKWGFIDKTGKQIVPFKYFLCGDFSEGLAKVANEEEKFGYINTEGKLVISQKYIDASDFSEGLACVHTTNGKKGYIDKKGKMVLKVKGDIYPFSEGLACVVNDYKVKYIDKTGKVKITKKIKDYDSYYSSFSDGLAAFYDHDKNQFGYINKKGKTVFTLSSSMTYGDDFYEGMCIVYGKDGKTGYVNKTGKLVIPTKYTEGYIFFFFLTYVKVKGKNGYIDKKGKMVIKPVYDKASSFYNGLAYVEKNGKNYYIDKNGKIVIKLP